MSRTYTEKNDDSMSEMLNGGRPEDNDIQIINRDDHDPFEGNFDPANIETPPALRDVMYNDYQDSNGVIHQHPSGNVSGNGGQAQYADEMHSIYGSRDANKQLATITQNKYVNSIPPLTSLSESVLPSGLNIQPLTLQGNLGSRNEQKSDKKIHIPKPKKETSSLKRTAFVPKMWSMVNDPANKEYIRWNDDGKTFQVFHREEFMKNILPKYFKHNNFASFVRQLNMYGWHKVQDISNGTLNQSKDEKQSDEVWQFENPYFIRGRKDLLDKIVRNKSVNQENEQSDHNQVNFQLVLNELDQIKMNQLAICEDIRRVRKDNKTLWQENYLTRERHQQQAQTLDKILKFLAAVYGNNANKVLDSGFFDDANQVTYNPYANQTQQFNPYATQAPNPYQKPRLMLTNQAHKRSSSGGGSEISGTEGHNQRHSNGSIEEIIRNYENNSNAGESPVNNVNKIYHQIINQDQAQSQAQVPSPRQYFPELSRNPNSPYNTPGTPGSQFLSLGLQYDPNQLSNSNELMNGLEQNIHRQGQSIQQVQDWIQKLASQQQQQQASINEINDNLKPDLEDFDVSEFLNNSNTSNNTSDPVVVTPGDTPPVSSKNRTPNNTDRNSGKENNSVKKTEGNGSFAGTYNSTYNHGSDKGNSVPKRSVEELYDEDDDDNSTNNPNSTRSKSKAKRTA
ncbi:uncharacterized protein PRCAT00003300001 [Priceomyces carsonii]|uniref:uncharacterized protein n=1 Tax=Priceomyces carsonii TaxID=28549 RepID=UPI002ED94869|nr:unnamed protein product [Priceomyces carsonii]